MLDTTLLELLSFPSVISSPFEASLMPHLPLSYFLQKAQNHDFHKISINKRTPAYDLLCDICMTPSSKLNSLILCTCCGISVHSDCYRGELLINTPINEWICERCLYVIGHKVPCDSLKCSFCKESKGSLVRMDTNWLHIVCVLWYRNAKFVDRMRRKCIIQIGEAKDADCVFCARKDKFQIQCEQKECQITFHAKCAQISGLRPAMFIHHTDKKYKLKFYCKHHRQELFSVDYTETKLRASHMMELYVPINQESSKLHKSAGRKIKKDVDPEDVVEIISDGENLVIRCPQIQEIKKEPEEAKEHKLTEIIGESNGMMTCYIYSDSETDTLILETKEYHDMKKATSLSSEQNGGDYINKEMSSTILMNENFLMDDGVPQRVIKKAIKKQAANNVRTSGKKQGRKKKLTTVPEELREEDAMLEDNTKEPITIVETNGTQIIFKKKPRSHKSKSSKKKETSKKIPRTTTKKAKPRLKAVIVRGTIPADSQELNNTVYGNSQSFQDLVRKSTDIDFDHPTPSIESLLTENSLPMKRTPDKTHLKSSAHPKPKKDHIVYRTLEKALQTITGLNSISTLDELDKEFKRYLRQHSKQSINYYDISVIPDLSAYLNKTQIQHDETKILVFQYSCILPQFSDETDTISMQEEEMTSHINYSDDPGTVKKLKLGEQQIHMTLDSMFSSSLG